MEPLTTTTKWTFTQKILLQFEWLPGSFTYRKWQPKKKTETINLINWKP
ncbi:MAG TPA: hypothetical protein VFH07_13050 [Chitinophagaceae bacterium]|jgi:hypothetical protein|nr:hypothetical protein [Chitinophagaceae bacterium]